MKQTWPKLKRTDVWDNKHRQLASMHVGGFDPGTDTLVNATKDLRGRQRASSEVLSAELAPLLLAVITHSSQL